MDNMDHMEHLENMEHLEVGIGGVILDGNEEDQIIDPSNYLDRYKRMINVSQDSGTNNQAGLEAAGGGAGALAEGPTESKKAGGGSSGSKNEPIYFDEAPI